MSHPQPVPDLETVRRQVAGRLQGRRVMVTGAASGIGRAVAELFLDAGAQVALLDRQAPAPVANAGERALCLTADITDTEAVAAAVAQAAQAFGGLDGLVNSAGIANTDPAARVALADWRRVIDVNLTGTLIVAQACEPWLRQASGATVVNLSSGQGLRPSPNRAAYAASKAGVIGLTRCLAQEWGPHIRVNSLCPGVVDTPMVHQGYGAGSTEQLAARYSLARIAEAHEIALAALYLSSNESAFVTGIALAVDGGRTFH
jgi:NAD(P)-dependent dehydrogenase (short-subunit alcohol dehydrogenase family)